MEPERQAILSFKRVPMHLYICYAHKIGFDTHFLDRISELRAC
jgi:hypothetical protein